MSKLSVLCFGYNGENNTGSEAKLLATIEDLRRVIGDRLDHIACITLSEQKQRRYIKDPSIKLYDVGTAKVIKSLARLILGKRYDIVVLSEGSTFIDHFGSPFMWMFCLAALIAKLRGEKVIAYANDCGKLKWYNRWLLRTTLNKLDLIMFRNPDAAARAKEYGVTKPIHVTADGAYCYPPPSREFIQEFLNQLGLDPRSRPIVGLAPKEFFWWPVRYQPFGRKQDQFRYVFYHSWPPGSRECSAKYIQQNAAYADYCVEQLDADIAIIAMEHMDHPPSEAIYRAMKHRDRARLIPSDIYDLDQIMAVLSSLKLLISTRYHACVLSSWAGVPAIAVSSDTRLEALFKELGMMELYIDYVEHAHPVPPKVDDLYGLLVQKTNLILEREQEYRSRILEMHKAFLQRAELNRKLFQDWFQANFG